MQPSRTLASKPSPPTGDYQVVIQSIGTAGAGLISALRPVVGVSDEQLAALLYRAPSQLLQGVPLELAEGVARVLEDAGVDARVQRTDEVVQTGVGNCEVAISCTDVRRMPELLAEVAKVLGCDGPTAVKVLCRDPAVLLGGVSEATATALESRFRSLGAEVDVSRPDEATFDLFVADCAGAVRNAVYQTLRQSLPEADQPRASISGPIVVSGLGARQARSLWSALSRSVVGVRMCNRDFARFDVRLFQATSSPSLAEYLVREVGIPEKVIGKVLTNLPIVLADGVRLEHAHAMVAALARLGARAEATLTAFQPYGIAVESVTNADAAAGLIRSLGEVKGDVDAKLKRLPAQFEGPFTKVRARWLHHALVRAGARATVVVL